MATESKLQGLRIACLATNGFEWAELDQPKRDFEAAGAKVDVISQESGEIYGMKHHDKASTVKVDRTFKEAKPSDYDAVLLPGGALNADTLRAVPEAQRFVQEAERAGKPIAVICHGGWLLVSAGLVKGHTMTSWPTVQDDIKNAGGNWVDEEVHVDGRWISSRKPDDIPAFVREATRVFAENRQSQRKVA